jgi:hypothetical protein
MVIPQSGEIDFAAYPDAHGRSGPYGGVYVAETLMAPLAELTAAYLRLRRDPAFIAELDRDLKHYVGRPSPIYHADACRSRKREDPEPHRRAQDQNTRARPVARHRQALHHRRDRRWPARRGQCDLPRVSAPECVVYMGWSTSSAGRSTSIGEKPLARVSCR